MAREIKFRAWSKKQNEMYDVLLIDFKREDKGIGLGYLANPMRGVLYPKHEDVEIMQFTGLHDKNSVEIYEEDIVKFLYYRKETIIPVKWGTDGWWVSGPGWFKHLYWVADKCEVIGNIWENPELI